MVEAAETLADFARGRIVREVEGGHFRVGERLPSERILSRELRVGRSAIREAKARLLAEGRLVEGPGGSICVGPKLGEELRRPKKPEAYWRNLLACRRMLWAEGARIASRRALAKPNELLLSSLEDYESDIRFAASPQALAATYAALGSAFVSASRNSTLVALEAKVHVAMAPELPLWFAGPKFKELSEAQRKAATAVGVGDTRLALRAIRKEMAAADRLWIARATQWLPATG